MIYKVQHSKPKSDHIIVPYLAISDNLDFLLDLKKQDTMLEFMDGTTIQVKSISELSLRAISDEGYGRIIESGELAKRLKETYGVTVARWYQEWMKRVPSIGDVVVQVELINK